jgi:serine/threonine protein kinase
MDLETFLQGDPSSWIFRHNDELFEELRGLAAALADVHSYRCQEMQLELIGCHHDLKPSNILLFAGRLTLADFGLSRLVPPKQGSGTYFKDCLGDYFSPESLDEKLSQQIIGRASDVWSLGCIIIEVITFNELGAEGVRQFRSTRKTEGRPRYINSWFHSGGKMKTEVENWLSKLRANAQDDNAKKLVTLAQSMLEENPAHRPSSHTVQLELTRIALMSLSERVAKQFQTFLESHDDFHLRLEKKRFDEWCDGVGVTPTKSQKNNSRIDILSQFCSEVRQHMLAMCELIPTIPLVEGIPIEYESTENLEDLYVSVRDHNDFLWKILPLETRKDIQLRWRRQRLETSELNELEAMEQSADREVACLATMKRLFLLMEETDHSSGTEPISPSDINVEEEFGEHSLGSYTGHMPDESLGDAEDGKRVIIEWWDVKDWDPSALEELYIRMSMIASLPNAPDRPPEFCVLSCEGYYYDRNKHRFGIVYAIPLLATASRSLPITLRDIIDQNKSVAEGRRPLLGDRFALALSVCFCVTEFHTVGWLHHDLCPDNIIFFPSTTTTNCTITIRDPYIIGFNHSRPDEDGNLTLERSCVHSRRVYEHPDYKVPGGHRRFHKAFDYYSLGVVLLEIGLWYTMQNFDDEFETLISTAKRDLLVKYAQQLGAYMGELYRNAVVYCLTAEYGEGLDVEEGFQQNVLGPLSKCRV